MIATLPRSLIGCDDKANSGSRSNQVGFQDKLSGHKQDNCCEYNHLICSHRGLQDQVSSSLRLDSYRNISPLDLNLHIMGDSEEEHEQTTYIRSNAQSIVQSRTTGQNDDIHSCTRSYSVLETRSSHIALFNDHPSVNTDESNLCDELGRIYIPNSNNLIDTQTSIYLTRSNSGRDQQLKHKNQPLLKTFISLFIVVQIILLANELSHSVRRDNLHIDSRSDVNTADNTLLNYPQHSNRYGRGFITFASAFDELERIELRDEAKKMFYHAYHSYINTYPADEILPISCQGRFRQSQDLSEIDDSIGNFSLTLVDSLDTLVMMGDLGEFESGIKRIIRDINFDMDMVVSVFETNIRMLGGLLSAHVLAKSIQDDTNRSIRHFNQTERRQLDWYNAELLDLAEDLGRRLLPAFDTKTGIPHPRVNLKFGLESNGLRSVRETCTACAGSLILEFATLSRLTGSSIFEEKARTALDAIWDHRHRSTNLVGTVLHVDSGEWVRRESGVGAGSDSYYEYLMKAYILLGDPTYLYRFNRHYSSVMRYISRGPFLIDVHMHRPNRVAKGFMDALSAFWPGLQVLKGDLRAAISTHAMFNEVIRRHSYLPEAFTTDLQVYWANHQMRPEFLESTFFLHRATQEDYYLEIGKDILRKLQDLKVDCGFAGLKDVRTGVHDDRMSSFVLAETLKYLYLLFSTDNETYVDLDRFIFSTEGHLLPMNLVSMSKNVSIAKAQKVEHRMKEFNNIGALTNDIKVKLISESEILRTTSRAKEDKKSESYSGETATREKVSTIPLTIDISDGKNAPGKRRGSEQLNSAAVARLLLKMSDKFNQDKSSTINLADYEHSCPSLEAQEMRFDGRYHPFLNKWIGSASTLESANLFKAQLNHMQLLERVKEFTTTDPDYLRLSTAWGLAVSVQPNGMVKLMLNPEFAETSTFEPSDSDKATQISSRLIQESGGEVGSSQCIL